MVTFTPDGRRILTANEGEPVRQKDTYDPVVVSAEKAMGRLPFFVFGLAVFPMLVSGRVGLVWAATQEKHRVCSLAPPDLTLTQGSRF